MNTRITLIGALALILVSCSGASEENGANTRPNLQVDGYVVSENEFDNKLITTANLLPSEQVELRAPISGQVLRINFQEGATVRKGQSIVQLDDRSWKAQLIGLNAQLKNAESDYDRKKSLSDVGGSSDEEIESAFTLIENLKSQIQLLRVNIDLANVDAPFSGTIGMRDFSIGAYLSAGDPITVLTESGKLKVDFTIASQYSKSIKMGNKVIVLIDGDSLEAEVYAISPLINVDSRTLNVRALLDAGENSTILPGTFAEVIVSTDYSNNALLVPTQAVVPEINEQTVYLYKSGFAEKRNVQLGNRTADLVHIISGINKGDTLITTGLLQVKHGMPVTLQSVNK